MCTKSQSSRISSSHRGLIYEKPLHELAGRGVSASFSSDDSDNAFEFSEVYSQEPPVSPKLQTFAPPWERASSNADLVFISAKHQQYGSAKDSAADVDMVGASCRSYIHRGVIASADQNSQKKRVDLRSLMLERRELEQLPPLVSSGHRMEVVDADQKPYLRSSPSSSSSASSSKSSSSLSTVSCNSSPRCNLDHGKKNKRWSVKLDFFHINKASPSKGTVDLRHHIDGSTATTDEMGDTHNEAGVVVDYNNAIFESPRKSTCSLTSSISSSAIKREKKMIKGALSAPVSPAGSPSRAPFSPAKGPVAHSAKGHLQALRSRPGLKSPLSPHAQAAQHYQRQRAEELRRRTFLPYRQPLFGGCFFKSPPGHSQVACRPLST